VLDKVKEGVLFMKTHELEKELGISKHTIFYYEKEGIVTPQRDENGYRVQDVQDYLGLSCKQSIYKWLKGKSLPNLEHLCALSYLFHCTLDDLVVTQMNYYVIKETICQYTLGDC